MKASVSDYAAEADLRAMQELWRAGERVVAWGWIELPDHLNLAVDPAYDGHGLVDEVLGGPARGPERGRDAGCGRASWRRRLPGPGAAVSRPRLPRHHQKPPPALLTTHLSGSAR
ncbi:hypothetical protein [Nonomuraea sp. NPDC049028]|uniref:hypothetical protein n=1 Tax=Nonomuraea sp. NPDC049028 TaxID=3364348 RepID=UPI003721DBFB